MFSVEASETKRPGWIDSLWWSKRWSFFPPVPFQGHSTFFFKKKIKSNHNIWLPCRFYWATQWFKSKCVFENSWNSLNVNVIFSPDKVVKRQFAMVNSKTCTGTQQLMRPNIYSKESLNTYTLLNLLRPISTWLFSNCSTRSGGDKQPW